MLVDVNNPLIECPYCKHLHEMANKIKPPIKETTRCQACNEEFEFYIDVLVDIDIFKTDD